MKGPYNQSLFRIALELVAAQIDIFLAFWTPFLMPHECWGSKTIADPVPIGILVLLHSRSRDASCPEVLGKSRKEEHFLLEKLFAP